MKKIFQALVVSIFAVGVTWGVVHLRSLADLEAATFDIRQIAFPPATKVTDDIVMVWLDEATMQSLPYRSPIPRDFLATLTEKIATAEPKLIAYDIFFKDPSFTDADQALAKVLTLTPTYAVVPRRESGEVDLPLPLFREALSGIGLADLPFNPFDATVRDAQLSFSSNEGTTTSFAATLFHAATGNDPVKTVADQKAWPTLGPVALTPFTDEHGKISIRFAGPPGKPGDLNNRFKIYSAALIAKGLVPAAWLSGKIVLVGAGYEDLKDAFLTPYYAKLTNYARMNGVEIHANILNSLLTGQFYYHLTPWQRWSLMGLIALIVSLAAVIFSPWQSVVLYATVVVGEVVLAVFLFHRAGIILPIVFPFVSGTASIGFGVGLKALTEGRQKRWIKGVFAHYVPPQLVDRITENPDMLKLGGEERIVTSFFSDIASFTTISEKLNPTTLVKFLNEYLGKMNTILFRHGATLDKYEGDAIIAFFNAPVDVLSHELSAVRSALELQAACREITETWRSVVGRDVVTRVGLNTGPAVVGNMGSESRFDYTAIGDTINLASRLEGANKFYDTRILCAEATVKGLSDEIVTRPVDRLRVKGKTEPILVYEAVGFAQDVSAETMEKCILPYRAAFANFEARDLKGAMAKLATVIAAFPEDGPARDLMKRIERGLAEPQWDLVTELTSK